MQGQPEVVNSVGIQTLFFFFLFIVYHLSLKFMLKTRLTERKHRFAQVTKLSRRPKWFTGVMVEGGGQNIKITYIVCGTYICIYIKKTLHVTLHTH